jgi:hypothetical protein
MKSGFRLQHLLLAATIKALFQVGQRFMWPLESVYRKVCYVSFGSDISRCNVAGAL